MRDDRRRSRRGLPRRRRRASRTRRVALAPRAGPRQRRRGPAAARRRARPPRAPAAPARVGRRARRNGARGAARDPVECRRLRWPPRRRSTSATWSSRSGSRSSSSSIRSPGDHSRAVGSWCRRIAERLGLSREEALHASRSGLIHDIGKSSVPLGILTAPRRLDDEERAIMEAHVLFGEQHVLEHPVLHPFASAVRNHHERFDGRGYPDGSRGARIPLTTRIVSVADSFNAMIDRRPYRAPRAPSRRPARAAPESRDAVRPRDRRCDDRRRRAARVTPCRPVARHDKDCRISHFQDGP